MLQAKCSETLRISLEYVIPLIFSIAVIILLASTLIFSSSKSQLYKLLKANSITDTILFIVLISVAHISCKKNPKIILSYWFQWYDLLIRIYLIRVICLISTLINIKIAFQRYKSFKISSNLSTLRDQSGNIKKSIILFVFFSMVFYSPNLFYYYVHEIKNITSINQTQNSQMETYALMLNSYSKRHTILRIIFSISESICSLGCLVFMIILNVLIKKHFCKSNGHDFNFKVIYFNGKQVKLNSDLEIGDSNSASDLRNYEIRNRSNQITKMVIWISTTFIFQQILIITTNIIKVFIDRTSEIHFRIMAIVLFLYAACQLSNSIFYYLYYKQYRKFVRRFFTMFSTCLEKNNSL